MRITCVSLTCVKILLPKVSYFSSTSLTLILWKARKEAMMAPVLTPQIKSNSS